MTQRRDVTAVHEAGHFLIAHLLLGERVDAISIRPSAGHGGIMLVSGHIDFAGHDREAPLALADPALRRRAELVIMLYLAGEVAESLFTPTLDYREEPAAAAIAAAGSDLPAAAKTRLAESEAQPEDESLFAGDTAEANEVAFRLAGQRAGPVVALARAEARSFLVAHAAATVALAEELLRLTVMSGEQAAAVVDAIEGGAPR